MTAEISAAAVIANRPDMQPTGERYVELAMTGVEVAGTTPHQRRSVAGFLQALLLRAPLADGDAYAPHRAILGSLCVELEAAAVTGALDEPQAAPADLRDPATTAREHALLRETREWADLARARATAGERALVDDLLATSAYEHQRATTRLDAATREAEAFLAGNAPAEADDVASLFA